MNLQIWPRPLAACAAILTASLLIDAGKDKTAEDPSFRFLAIGDCPYSKEQEVQFRRILRQSEREHFTRMEVFGSPNVAGVVVTVDPKDPEVFTFRPYYIDED